MDKEEEKRIKDQLIIDTYKLIEGNQKRRKELEKAKKENAELHRINLELKNLLKSKYS